MINSSETKEQILKLAWKLHDRNTVEAGIVIPVKQKGHTVKCKCPKCEKLHRVQMYWSGRGTPKKFCETCKKIINKIEFLDEQVVPVNDIYRYKEITEHIEDLMYFTQSSTPLKNQGFSL